MKNLFKISILFLVSIFIGYSTFAQPAAAPISWPSGKKVAVSLTFDDARFSQVDAGTPLLDQYGVKATFFLVPSAAQQRLAGWKKATANGHEIGNHSLHHPCSGNFPWSRSKAIENYTMEQMRSEMIETNDSLQAMLGVRPEVYAYPCGHTFIGRGADTKSSVPLVAEVFLLGRLWLSEGPNDPAFCDFAQLTGMEMDGKTFDQILPMIEDAKKTGSWLVLAGHEMGELGHQTTRLSMLKALMEYAKDPAHGIWLAPAGTVAKFILTQRKK